MPPPATHAHPAVNALLARAAPASSAKRRGPGSAEGVRRLIDYQDPAYAALYLDRMARHRRGAATTR